MHCFQKKSKSGIKTPKDLEGKKVAVVGSGPAGSPSEMSPAPDSISATFSTIAAAVGEVGVASGGEMPRSPLAILRMESGTGIPAASSFAASSATPSFDAHTRYVIAWHEDRNASFWDRVDDAIFAIRSVNPDPPIYLQEPERYRQNNSAWLTKAGFGADVRGAYSYQAAARCFHNGGSFRMNGSSLQAKLQAEEKAFLTCLSSYIGTGGC